MTLYRWKGKLLRRNGKLARHKRCCCDRCHCCQDERTWESMPDELSITVTIANCVTFTVDIDKDTDFPWRYKSEGESTAPTGPIQVGDPPVNLWYYIELDCDGLDGWKVWVYTQSDAVDSESFLFICIPTSCDPIHLEGEGTAIVEFSLNEDCMENPGGPPIEQPITVVITE